MFVLERRADFSDFTGGKHLPETLKLLKTRLSRVRLSPDGRHVHVCEPEVGLVTFDKSEQKVQKTLSRPPPVVDVCYLRGEGGRTAVLVVFESGKAEFWRFQEEGWTLLQTTDLCNSPTARILSVCACANLIVWCEERPPSENSATNKLRYCVCRREFGVLEGGVTLGGVKITLYNNPKFTVVGGGECVHLLPDASSPVSRCFLTWFPQQDFFRVSTTGRSVPLKNVTAKESDFQKLVLDCLGFLSAVDQPDICSFSSSPGGDLLLLLSTGWVCHLRRDGTLRQVYKVAENSALESITCAVIQDALAVVAGEILLLVDLKCGRDLGKVVLPSTGVFLTHPSPHFLSETGLYAVTRRDPDAKSSSLSSGALLVEAVFEEACKYYQQRSLSSTRLTVEALKSGGRFQAPISLAGILRVYLNLVQNSGLNDGQEKLRGSLEAELKALVSLEEVKKTLVQGGEKEVEEVCEALVEKEVTRLLSGSEMDKDNLLYLNSIFRSFPRQAWQAAQRALQLHYNGEGVLSTRATAEVWKTVLSPAGTCGASVPLTNGGPKHSYRGDHKSTLPSVLPVFELLCCSILNFQPAWLAQFLELVQDQQGSAAPGLSLVSSSWNCGRGEDLIENKVPLYKRTLCVLNSLSRDQDLEVDVMLVSGRPKAILQALRILIRRQQWERVTQLAQKFSKQSPLLNKEIFTTLLCEVTQHRELDPYLDLLWTLCPEDATVTSLLNLILKNLPAPNLPPPTPFSESSPPAPFPDPQAGLLTMGLLKPLLRKVLHRETKPSQNYADILQSPSFPPPTPPRLTLEVSDPHGSTPSEDSAHQL